MICPGCHTLNFRDYKYCRECGRKLEPVAAPQPTVAMRPPAAGSDDAQVQLLLHEAFQAFDAGSFSDAALACQGALAIRPDSTAAHSLLGLIYERLGELEDAIQQFRIVLDLNPASKADRAKLTALLRQTQKVKPRWYERLQGVRLPPPTVIGGTAAAVACVILAGMLVVARSSSRAAEARRRAAAAAAVRMAFTPRPEVAIPPPTTTPPPPLLSLPAPPASSAADVGAFPHRTLSNGPMRVFQTGAATPGPLPRSRMAARPHPTFLPPAPIYGLPREPGPAISIRPASGPVPVLPDASDTSSQPASEKPEPPSAPAEARPPLAPPAGEPTGEAPSTADGGGSISIRRLDSSGASGPARPASPGITMGVQPAPPAPAVAPPTLAEARRHFALANDLRNRGDLAAAYSEYEYARELFRLVSQRGGTEGLYAAQGIRASQRAMDATGSRR